MHTPLHLALDYFKIKKNHYFIKYKNTYNVPDKIRIVMDNAIKAMIIEKIDNSAALYSALVKVNPIIPSGSLKK